jgi:hypothetical protein
MKNKGSRMEKQNITLAIPKDLLNKAKSVAAKRNITLSRLLVSVLEALVSEDERYEEAKQRHLELLERGFNLGTQGQIDWKRDALHDR